MKAYPWFCSLALAAALAGAPSGKPFIIRVTDDQTHRGVPLVPLRTLNEVSFITDTAGIAAIDDPALIGHSVFFHVNSHGYEFTQKFFDQTGAKLQVAVGGSVELKIHRVNIAERIYRITGAGIYATALLPGFRLPSPNRF